MSSQLSAGETGSALRGSTQQVVRVVESQLELGASGQNRPQTLFSTPILSPALPPDSPPCSFHIPQNHWLLPCHRWNYVAMVF